MRIPNDCFYFGRIGMKPKRGVFVEAPGDAGKKAKPPENKNASKLNEKSDSALDNAVLQQQTELNEAVAKMSLEINKILDTPGSSPAKRAAALKARIELDKIPNPTKETSPTALNENLNKAKKVLEYHEKAAPLEKKTAEYRALLENKLPWVKQAEDGLAKRVAILTAAGIDQKQIDELKKIHNAWVNQQKSILTDVFPRIMGKETVSLEAFAANPSAFTDFSKGLDLEKKNINDNAVNTQLMAIRQPKLDEVKTQMTKLNSAIHLDAGKTAEKTNKYIDSLYNENKEKWETAKPLDNKINLKAGIAQVMTFCVAAQTEAKKANDPDAPKLRGEIISRLKDRLDAFFKEGQVPAEEPKDAPASTPPPVSEVGPVKPPPATEAVPAQPLQSGMAVNLDIPQRVQKLSPTLAQMVVSAPGEYQDALAKIADRGEKQGEMINFKLLFNKTYIDYFFVKEGANKYVIKTLDPKTGAVANSLTYTSRNEAMRELKDGIILQRAAFYALSHPNSYKEYEKMKMIDMKGKLPGAGEVRKDTDPAPDPNREVKFRLDWEGFSDVSGNPIVTAKAKPFGAIEFTVYRDGVGLDGGNVRTGLASSMDDFFRQLQHLEKWAEDYKPGREKSSAAAKEWNYALLNNPANFFAHQERIGRPVYFGINPKTGNTDMALDWGGGGTTELDQNPYVRMRLEPNGMIGCQAEYKGKKIDFLVANVPQIIDKLVQVRAEMTGELPRVAGSWTDQRLLTHRENPFALPPENAAQPAAVAVAQNAVAAQGAVPGAVAAAAPAVPVAVVVKDMPTAAQTAPGGAPAVGPKPGPVAAPAVGTGVPVKPNAVAPATPPATREANDAKYLKYGVAAKAVSDYMNDTGIKYLKEYIGKGNIGTMEGFDAALTQLVNTVAQTTSFDKPAADVSVEYPITINNVRCKIRFTPDGPKGQIALFLPPEVKQNLANSILNLDTNLANKSALAMEIRKGTPQNAPQGAPATVLAGSERKEVGNSQITQILNGARLNNWPAPGTKGAWNADEVVNPDRKTTPVNLSALGVHAGLQIEDSILGENMRSQLEKTGNKAALFQLIFQAYNINELINQGCVYKSGNENNQSFYMIKSLPPRFVTYLNSRQPNSQKTNFETLVSTPTFDIRQSKEVLGFIRGVNAPAAVPNATASANPPATPAPVPPVPTKAPS